VDYYKNKFNIAKVSNEFTDGTGELSNLKCGMLILHGEKDSVVSVQEIEETRKFIKGYSEINLFP